MRWMSKLVKSSDSSGAMRRNFWKRTLSIDNNTAPFGDTQRAEAVRAVLRINEISVGNQANKKRDEAVSHTQSSKLAQNREMITSQ